MKKILLILAIVLLAAGGFAQTGKFIGGINLSNYHSTDRETSTKFGYWGGLGMEWGSEFLIGEFDVLYFQKGAKVGNVEYTLSELLFPAFIKIKFMPGTSPYILGGGEVGYVLSHNAKGGNGETGRDVVKSLDYGLIFGAGLELWFGDAGILVEVRYHYGLAAMGKGEGFDFKTNSIAILVGFVFF